MNKKDFLALVKKGALSGWENHKILPSLMGAQAILESGWGGSELAKEANNLFGIKDSDDWKGAIYPVLTKEHVGGKVIEVVQNFRKYDSMSDSILDHSKFFSSTDWRKKNYQHVFGEKDYKKAVNAILSPTAPSGYATDVNYAEKIISIIEENKLYEWDGKNQTNETGKEDVIVSKNGKIVVIDPGHGGSDGGSSGNGLTEKTWTLETSKLIQKYLEGLGYTVIMTRTNDTFVGLSQRAIIANNSKAHIFISVHFNAFASVSAKGYEDFIYSYLANGDNVTPNLQNKIHSRTSAYTKAQGIDNRGKKRADFAVIRETYMPAILLEAGFCTNPSDARAMAKNTFKDGFARAVVAGVNDFFGISGTITTTPPKPVEKPNSVSGNNYIVKKGDTLYSIAKANNVTVNQLLAWNPSIDPKALKIGARVTVKGGTSTYRVVKGDTLYSISGRHGMSVSTLASLNGIAVNSTLKIGQTLKVSGKEIAPSHNGGTAQNLTTYKVKAGDNLSTIAQKHGTTVQAIASANGIKNPSLISVGQTLKFKAGKTPAPAPAKPKVYTVKSGDTLSQIAVNLKVTEDYLAKKNGITNRHMLSVGQRLNY